MSDVFADLQPISRMGEKQTLEKGGSSWLAHRLAAPAVELNSFQDLADHWRRTVVVFKVKKPVGYEHGPWVAKNFRGGLGDALKRAASEQTENPDRPSALIGLFERHLIVEKHHVPSPMAIGIYEDGRSLEVVITLIGFSGIWREAVIYAAFDTLQTGVRVTEEGNVYPSWEIDDWYWFRRENFPLVKPDPKFRMEFLSPMVTGGSGKIKGVLTDTPVALASRLCMLARWQHVELIVNLKEIENWARHNRPEYDPARPPVSFIRRRRADRDKKVFIYGNMSELVYKNVPDDLHYAIQLGQSCMVGGSIVHGFGDYRYYPVAY